MPTYYKVGQVVSFATDATNEDELLFVEAVLLEHLRTIHGVATGYTVEVWRSDSGTCSLPVPYANN